MSDLDDVDLALAIQRAAQSDRDSADWTQAASTARRMIVEQAQRWFAGWLDDRGETDLATRARLGEWRRGGLGPMGLPSLPEVTISITGTSVASPMGEPRLIALEHERLHEVVEYDLRTEEGREKFRRDFHDRPSPEYLGAIEAIEKKTR